MATIIPYINFVDRAAAAMDFYESVFGGKADIQKDGDKVIHVEFHVDDLSFQGGDNPSQAFGRDMSLVLNCDSEVQLNDLYSKLVAGGRSEFAPMDSGWGAIIAHCQDQFGVTWMFNYDVPEN